MIMLLMFGSTLGMIFQANSKEESCIGLRPAIYRISAKPITPGITIDNLNIRMNESSYSIGLNEQHVEKQIKQISELCWRSSRAGQIQVDIYHVESQRNLLQKNEMQVLLKQIQQSVLSVHQLNDMSKLMSLVEQRNGDRIEMFDSQIKGIQGLKLVLLGCCVGLQMFVLHKMIKRRSDRQQV